MKLSNERILSLVNKILEGMGLSKSMGLATLNVGEYEVPTFELKECGYYFYPEVIEVSRKSILGEQFFKIDGFKIFVIKYTPQTRWSPEEQYEEQLEDGENLAHALKNIISDWIGHEIPNYLEEYFVS